MRVGLLLCDHVREHHIDIAGDYVDQFRALFIDHDVELVEFDIIGGEMPPNVETCDAWLITGSRHSVNDDIQWIRDLEEFTREVARSGVPLVGVCFGHQLLAKALGGTVAKAVSGWVVGSNTIETSNGSLQMMTMHQDEVETLPPGAEVTGWSERCPVAIMEVGETMMGIQGHPEMPAPYNRALIEYRRGIMSEETAEAGIASLRQSPDTRRLAGWIVDFLRRT